jgi:hypothetical protein
MQSNLSKSSWGLPVVDLILRNLATQKDRPELIALIPVFNQRKELAIQKYGTPLSACTPAGKFIGPQGTNGVGQAIEEVADCVVYLKYEQVKRRVQSVEKSGEIDIKVDTKLEKAMNKAIDLLLELQTCNNL